MRPNSSGRDLARARRVGGEILEALDASYVTIVAKLAKSRRPIA